MIDPARHMPGRLRPDYGQRRSAGSAALDSAPVTGADRPRGRRPLAFERIVDKNRVLALRARRKQRHRTADELLDPAYILDRLRGQLGPRPRARGRFPPAVDDLIDRFEPCPRALGSRKVVDFGTVQAVSDANFDLLETVEDIEFGEGQPGDAAGTDGLPHQYGIEPAATARPPRDRSELAPALSQAGSDLVLLLGRERPLSYPRAIRLADSEDVTDRARA